MTSDLFEAELRHCDRELRLQKRKVLLLVVTVGPHPTLENLSWCFCITSVLQPMDQGVISVHHPGISSGVQGSVDVTEKETDVYVDNLPLSEWARRVDCGVVGHMTATRVQP
jgi:hypothetical protein